MKKWLFGFSVTLVCALAVQTVQLPTYAKTIAAKRQAQALVSYAKSAQKIASTNPQHALSVQKLIVQIERAIKTCTDALGSRGKSTQKSTKVANASSAVSFPEINRYCPQLVDQLIGKQIVSLTGVLELPVLAQLMQWLVGLVAAATGASVASIVAMIGMIALVITAVMVLIGIIWCFANGEQCRKQTDAIKDAVLDFFHQHIMPRLRTLIGDEKTTREVEKTVVSRFDRDWKDTSTKIKNGASRAALIEEAKQNINKRMNALPQRGLGGPNNGNQNRRLPPKSTRASATNDDDGLRVDFLSDEQLKEISKVDEHCAESIRFMQEKLKEWMRKFNNEYINDKDPNISDAEKAYLSEFAKKLIDQLKSYFVKLRETMIKHKNTIHHQTSEQLYDDLIHALPKSINDKMGLAEMKNILDKLKYYYAPRPQARIGGTIIREREILINGKISISDPIFFLIFEIDFWYVFLTRVKSTIPKNIKECIIIPNTRCQIQYVNEFLLDMADALDDPKKVKKLCVYVQGTLSQFIVFIEEIDQYNYDHTERRYEKDIFNLESNAFLDISLAIEQLIKRIIHRK
jgi:6-pyruvoyl-tetrahydropterin synthase